MVRSIINSEKRIVQIPIATVAAAAIANIILVAAKQTPTVSNAAQISIGSVVKAIYVELWLVTDTTTTGTSITSVEKFQGDQLMTAAEAILLNAYTNKKNLLETHQGLTGDDATNPVPFYRGWIKIPKGKQRFGIADGIVLNIAAIAANQQFCGLAIFKVYN